MHYPGIMRFSCCFTILFILCLAAPAIAGGKGRIFGAGVIAGEPTGISLKQWFNKRTAIDAAIGWSFNKEDRVNLHMDWLSHRLTTVTLDKNPITFYYGIGGRLKLQGQSRFGVRIPTGVDFFLKKTPVEFFGEVVPILDLVPETKISFNIGVGARYYFTY